MTDTAVFTGAVTGNAPTLSIDRSINGLNFQSSGWVLGGTAQTLTLGAGGITTAALPGTNTISSNISLGAAQNWTVGLGNTLALAGQVSGTNMVTVNGAGRLNLTGSLAFNSVMTISSGTVGLAQGRIGTSGSTGSITLNGGTLLTTGSSGIGGATTSGTLVVNGGLLDTGNGGILELMQTGSARSTFAMTGGTVNIGTSLASGSNTVAFLGGVLNVWTRMSYYLNGGTVLGGGSSQFVMNLNGNGGNTSKFAGGLYILANGVLNVDNSVYNNTDRLYNFGTENNVSVIGLKGGNLNFIGNSAANSSETYQGTTVSQGNSTVTLTAGANRSFVVTSGTGATLAGLTRTAGATVLFRGSNLGLNAQTTANSTNFLVTNPSGIGLVGTNTTGSGVTNLAILPYAIGDTSATGLGTGFVTYDSTRGIRLLAADEYSSSVSAATASGTSDANVKLTSVDTLATTGTINSLVISSGTLNGAAVKLASGALLATGTGNQINSSTLDFGTREGIITVANDLLVSGTITGSGGLTKSGAGALTLGGSNTYTGATTINQGLIIIGSATGLGSSNSIAFNGGNLKASTSATTAATITLNNVVTSSTISVDNGTSLNLSGVISGAGALTTSGQGAIAFGGSNTYTGGLNITSGTVYSNNASAFGKGNVSVLGTSGTTFVQLLQGLTINPGYGLTIGGTTGAPGIVDTGTGIYSLTAGTTTINSGGVLQISSTWSNVVVNGNVVVNNGGTIQSLNNGPNAPTDVIQGDVTLNSGATLSTCINNFTYGLFGRLAIKGNFVANAGSTIADNFIGYIALAGTSAVINSGVTFKTPTSGQGVNEFAFVLNRGSGTTALTSGVALDTIFIRDQDFNPTGTNFTALVTVTATGQNIGRIVYTNQDGTVTSSTATVKLGSDLTVIAGKAIINQSYGNNSTSPVALDLNGHTYDASLTSSNGAWSPNQAGNGSSTTSPWYVTSSTGVGTFRAGSFNLTGTYTDVTIGSNVILEATQLSGTSDLGLKAGGTGVAKIDSTSTFAFNRAGTHTLQATGTYADGSSRSIGNLQVGNGTSVSTLKLGSAITTGSGSTVTVNAGSTLDLQNSALNTSGAIQLNGGAVTGSSSSSFNIAGKVTASGTVNSSISAPIALSGTQTFEVTNASTSLSIVGNISGATGGLLKTGAGSLFLNGNSSYSGITEVDAGLLGVNGTLTAAGGVNVISGASLSGTGIVSGTVNNSGAISGGLTFNNDVTINNGATAAAKAFNGNILNNGTITSDVTVQSTKTLSGNGTASGAVNVQSATINGNGMHLGATTFDGQSTLSGTTTASSVTINSGTTTASGVNTSNGNLSVSVGSTLTNTGSFSANIVNVANTATLTNNGTLNGTVNVSGLLNGAGIINGALTIKTNGELAPGNSPGATTVAGNLTVETGAKISMQIEGTTTAGVDYDQIVVTGASSLVTLNTGSVLNLTITDGVFTDGALILIENQSNNAIVGTFSSVVIGGSTYDVSATNKFSYNGKEYELRYNVNSDSGSTANDFELAVIPEPSTWAMLLGGLGSLVFFRRLRRDQTLG